MSTETISKGRPILFSGEMVRAILDGRKTQTRRIVKAPSDPTRPFHVVGSGGVQLDGARFSNIWCPYGDVGDRLWVRETWCEMSRDGWWNPYEPRDALHNALGIPYRNGAAYRAQCDEDGERCRIELGYKWSPSIHMPRWASRLTLEITNVRVERMQDGGDRDFWGKEQWSANPWVWCIEFQRIES